MKFLKPYIARIVAAALAAAATMPLSAQFFDEETPSLIGRPDCFLSEESGTEVTQHRTNKYQSDAPMRATGTPRIPVILAQFTDVKDSLFYGSDAFGDWKTNIYPYFNGNDDGTPFVVNGFYMASIKDYFRQQSDGKFVPSFELLDPVTLSHNRAYYIDKRSTGFTTEVLTAMAEQIDDVSRFDSNGDGVVDMALVVFAGSSRALTRVADALWAWENSMTTTVRRSDNTQVKFACKVNIPNQLFEDGLAHSYIRPTIGVTCHEFCHALGLPDFYDTKSAKTAPGMDVWSLMDYGENLNNGYTPTNLNAVERDYLGWRALEVLNPEQPRTLHLKALGEGGVGYKMVNAADANECYVLECRNTNSKDCDHFLLSSPYWLDGHMGLLVYHQTLDDTWNSNTVNNTAAKQRMTIAPANNQFELLDNIVINQGWVVYRNEIRGHIYPGTSGNTELTDTSVPNSVVFTGDVLGQPIYDIEMDEENRIHLKYMPRGTLDAPSVFRSTADLHHVTLAWDAPENADLYRLEYQVDELEAETVDSLENTSYELGSLSADTKVLYRVMAMNDEWRNSPFSDWQTVSTPTDVTTLRVPKSEQVVDVYSTTGIQMGRCMRSQIARYVRVRGIVILRYEDGSTEKVLVQ